MWKEFADFVSFESVFISQKDYERVLEWEIFDLKLAWQESIFKIVGAIIHSKICYLLLTKEIIFFVRPSKLCLRNVFLKFSSFLRLRYS